MLDEIDMHDDTRCSNKHRALPRWSLTCLIVSRSVCITQWSVCGISSVYKQKTRFRQHYVRQTRTEHITPPRSWATYDYTVDVRWRQIQKTPRNCALPLTSDAWIHSEPVMWADCWYNQWRWLCIIYLFYLQQHHCVISKVNCRMKNEEFASWWLTVEYRYFTKCSCLVLAEYGSTRCAQSWTLSGMDIFMYPKVI